MFSAGLQSVETKLEEIEKEMRPHIKSMVKMFASDSLEHVLEELCHFGGDANSNLLKALIQSMFVLLEDETDHDLSNLFQTLMSAHPRQVLEALIEMHGTKQMTKMKPTTLSELRCIIRDAADGRQKIKAVSTNYAGIWTDIGASKGIIIDTSGLKDSPRITCLKDGIDENGLLRNFEAGITIGEIQEKLWPTLFRQTDQPETYRVLENATSGTGLSLAGTISTGAHGNGLRTGIVADAVVSFQMFTIDADWKIKRYQIEPLNGITDPLLFKKEHEHDEDKFELIQNDDRFNASVVNIGCMGVVYSYVLRTVPGFYLTEERKLYKWREAKHIITQLYNEEGEELYNFQIIGSPYAYKLHHYEDSDHQVLISTLRRTRTIGVRSRPAGHSLVPMELLDKALVALGDFTKQVIPLAMHFSLLYLVHEPVVLNAVEAFNTLSGIVAEEFNGVRSSECAMRSDGCNTVITIMESLHELYADIRHSNNRQLVNVPIALRFTAKSNKYMAMEHHDSKPTITIEQSIINGTFRADDTLRQFRERMKTRFDGRPHWGMLHELDAQKVEDLYNENSRKRFNSELNFFDPHFVFENEFAKRVFGRARRNEKQ